MKKILFKKNINEDKGTDNSSNIKMKSFKKDKKENQDFSFDEEKVIDALKNVMDPELPVSIVDLGLIYNVDVVDNNIKIQMTLTTPGCSMGSMISSQVENTLYALGAKNVIVEVIWDPPWNPNMMSEEAKIKLGM
ncbi:MAG: iron-sulfur cluster assembly protein [Thermodesulfobacteriota bacterium]|nr:iron-sulfur cluster assembly protein [Thermodesulfobacteriota bacterium]MEE2975411.1 iron-sulfur cluster assembly protein [Thermodesulfobacteriota bacterium]|tara:strand:+ start:4891 stop:5295 length:405 start_codon:yes stop_codon:yes gene_type:complete